MPPLNPWIAVPDGGPGAARTRRLRAAQELSVTGSRQSPEVVREMRPAVLDSWRRCAGSGVDPDGSTPPVDSPPVLPLVRATAAAAESELRERSTLRRPSGPTLRPAGLLAVLGRDRALLTLPTGRLELSLRHSELLLLLAEASGAGEGRTAEELAAEVHRGHAAAVTLRAELSRLRRLVGRALVGSRPYRLLDRIDTDLDTVRRLLGRGAVGEALRAYPGAVLPRSQAPGVAAARERVAALLRQGVLRSGRPEQLVRYAALPEARDDAAVWQACLERMPPGSAHRATAAANLLRLRRIPRR